MANPRRNTYLSSIISINDTHNSENTNNNISGQFQAQTLASRLSSLKLFLKKPHAIPFLLSFFLFLTWVSLRIQHSSHFSSPPHLTHNRPSRTTKSSGIDRDGGDDGDDRKANLVRFSSGYPSPIAKDKRGWLLDPISIARDAGISGGAVTCASLHTGEIRPGSLRGNHRHHTCNETFLIWGAKTIFRLENKAASKHYAEVTIGADEVAVATSPHGTAHALINVDPVHTTFFIGCQDTIIDYSNSSSDFNVWKDL